MNHSTHEVVLNDAQCYPLKDCWDRDVIEPEDLNSEIFVWQITPNLEGESTFIRSRQEALDYFKDVVELNLVPNSDGTMPDIEDCHVTLRLVSMLLGDYVVVEGN